MLSSSLAPYLPAQIAPEEWDELFVLKAGLGGSFGETHMIQKEDRLALLARSSSIGALDVVDLSSESLPRIQKQKWKTTLLLTTADGEAHEFTLSHDERTHVAAALEDFFLRREAWSQLADLLQVRVDSETGSERLELLHRLGRIFLDQLDQPEDAYRCFNDILTQRPDREEALEGMEGLFFRGFLEEKIGPILEERFRRHMEHEKLALTLTQLAPYKEKPSQRAAAWLEAAELRETRMSDSSGALLLLGKAFAEQPEDKEINQRFDDMASHTGEWSAARDLLRGALENDRTEKVKKLILWKIIKISELHLGDLDDVALSAKAILEIDEQDIDALRALDRTYQAQEKWQEQVAVLEKMIELLPVTTESTDLTLRLGVLVHETGENQDYAVKCFDTVLDRLSYHLEAYQRLEKIHRAREQWETLLELLERWQALEADESVVNRLLVSLGTVHEQLGNEERAIDFLTRLLGFEPEDHDALDALVRLYSKTGDWKNAIGMAERRAECSAGAAVQREHFSSAAGLAEEKLRDPKLALKLLIQAHRAAPGDLGVLTSIKRIAMLVHRDDALALALGGLLQHDEPSSDDKGPLRIELAETLIRLKRLEDAAEVWLQVLNEEPANQTALTSVLNLYESLERWHDAARVVAEAAGHAREEGEKIELLLKLAAIQDQNLRDLDQAVETYEQILELDPEHDEALERIEEIHRSRGDWDGIVEFYELRAKLAGKGGNRLRHLIAAARITSIELKKSEKALNTLLPLLRDHWQDPTLARSIGEIAARTELWTDAVHSLEKRLRKLRNPDDIALLGQNIDIAIETLCECIDDDRQDANFFLTLAEHYEEYRDEPERALELFRSGTEFPDSDEQRFAHEGLLRSLRATERWTELTEQLEAMAADANLGDYERGRLNAELAEIYTEQLGELEKGEEARKKSRSGSSFNLWAAALIIAIIASIVYYLRFVD